LENIGIIGVSIQNNQLHYQQESEPRKLIREKQGANP